jgi:hypothetical protein
VTVDIFITCGKHLHDRIISLKGKVWAHTISVTPSRFIEVSVPSWESEVTRIDKQHQLKIKIK